MPLKHNPNPYGAPIEDAAKATPKRIYFILSLMVVSSVAWIAFLIYILISALGSCKRDTDKICRDACAPYEICQIDKNCQCQVKDICVIPERKDDPMPVKKWHEHSTRKK